MDAIVATCLQGGHWQRQVRNKLDIIQGQGRPPLRTRLDTNPGFKGMSLDRQKRLRQLLDAGNPHLYNHAKYAHDMSKMSLMDMVADIKLAAGGGRGEDNDEMEQAIADQAAAHNAAMRPAPAPPSRTRANFVPLGGVEVVAHHWA